MRTFGNLALPRYRLMVTLREEDVPRGSQERMIRADVPDLVRERELFKAFTRHDIRGTYSPELLLEFDCDITVSHATQ